MFSLALSSCDKKNAELVNRRRKYVDPDKSVALTPAPQQDNVDGDHANPVGECSICVDKIEISDDYVTYTVCNRLFHIECIKSWWKCNSCELSDRGCCPAPACKTRIQIPVAKNLNFNVANPAALLTPAPQQDNVDVDHANPVGECSICVDKIEISDDYVTCTVCNRLFHIECVKSWWKCNSCELSDRGCCPAPACKTRIQIPVAKNLNFNLDLD